MFSVPYVGTSSLIENLSQGAPFREKLFFHAVNMQFIIFSAFWNDC